MTAHKRRQKLISVLTSCALHQIKVGVSQETYLFFPGEINFSIVSSIGGFHVMS